MLIEDKETPKEMRKLLREAKNDSTQGKNWREIADDLKERNGTNKDKPILMGQSYVTDVLREEEIKILARPTATTQDQKSYRVNIDKQIKSLETLGYDKHNMINVFTIITKITYNSWVAGLAHGLILTPYVEQPEKFVGFNSTEWFEADYVIRTFEMYYRMFDATDSTESMKEALTCIINHAYRTCYRYGVNLDELFIEYCKYKLENAIHTKEFGQKFNQEELYTQPNQVVFMDPNQEANSLIVNESQEENHDSEHDTFKIDEKTEQKIDNEIEIDQIVQALKAPQMPDKPPIIYAKQKLRKPDNILDLESVLSRQFMNGDGKGVSIVHEDNVFTHVYSSFTLREPWRPPANV